MRKITKQAIFAFVADQDFYLSNTSVKVEPFDVILSLYGHEIAYKNRETGVIEITNAGFFTNTTKERLNGLPGVNIQQKAGKWYLNGTLWDGSLQKIN